MATIAEARGFALGGKTGAGAPKRYIQLGATTGRPGDLVTVSSGYGVATSAATSNNVIIGLLEEAITSSSTGDYGLVSIVLPATEWEFTLDGATAVTDRYTLSTFEDSAAGTYVNLSNVATAGVFRIMDFAGEVGYFQKDRFVAEAGTSVTAGSDNRPAAQKGIATDTNARVIGYFTAGMAFE